MYVSLFVCLISFISDTLEKLREYEDAIRMLAAEKDALLANQVKEVANLKAAHRSADLVACEDDVLFSLYASCLVPHAVSCYDAYCSKALEMVMHYQEENDLLRSVVRQLMCMKSLYELVGVDT
jgi:hypothetical protein